MNRITEMLGIKYPIIQGAMQDVAKVGLVAAVSNAGGLGVLASGQDTPEQVREEIHKVKELTDKPFAVNLMFLNKRAPEIVDVVIEEGVKIVTTGAGTPKLYMPKLKEAGIKVMPVIPNVKIAKKMEDLGVDAVIAEGMESGGHIGTMASQTLWPQVVDAVNIPVIAAGGIADNRGVKAAMAMGAKAAKILPNSKIAKNGAKAASKLPIINKVMIPSIKEWRLHLPVKIVNKGAPIVTPKAYNETVSPA